MTIYNGSKAEQLGIFLFGIFEGGYQLGFTLKYNMRNVDYTSRIMQPAVYCNYNSKVNLFPHLVTQ